MISIKKNPRILFLALLFVMGTISCSDDADTSELVSVDNFSNSTINAMQKGTIGKTRCLKLIFPVTVQFSDESTAEVANYEELHETISAWLEENGLERSRENKPELVFPIQVVSEDGTVTDVESSEALQELKSECKGDREPRRSGNRGKGFHCFDLVFPLSATFGEETIAFDSKEAFKEAIQTYRLENGRDADRPEIVFPVTISYEDGTELIVNSREELKATKQACMEEG